MVCVHVFCASLLGPLSPTDKEDVLSDEFTFGAYQPTVATAPEGRQSRRQSVRYWLLHPLQM